jgi:hypothetical protein
MEAGSKSFHPEDAGDMFLRNVGWLSTGDMKFPEESTLHNRRCENLKSYIKSCSRQTGHGGRLLGWSIHDRKQKTATLLESVWHLYEKRTAVCLVPQLHESSTAADFLA